MIKIKLTKQEFEELEEAAKKDQGISLMYKGILSYIIKVDDPDKANLIYKNNYYFFAFSHPSKSEVKLRVKKD